MADTIRVLEPPYKIGGGDFVRVIERDGDAISQAWTGSAWVAVDGSVLTDVLTGRPVSQDTLQELQIP